MATITHTFTGKKPSKAQLLKIADGLIKGGFSSFEIVWGENCIEFEKFDGRWVGAGWIKEISGYDTASLINGK